MKIQIHPAEQALMDAANRMVRAQGWSDRYWSEEILRISRQVWSDVKTGKRRISATMVLGIANRVPELRQQALNLYDVLRDRNRPRQEG